MNYGKAFKELREEKGLSRAKVAKQIGCTPSALSKIESGKVTPKEKTIAKFCTIANIPMAYFLNRALTSMDYCTNTGHALQRLQDAIAQLQSYQEKANSVWIEHILIDMRNAEAELSGHEPDFECREYPSWLGFGQ